MEKEHSPRRRRDAERKFLSASLRLRGEKSFSTGIFLTGACLLAFLCAVVQVRSDGTKIAAYAEPTPDVLRALSRQFVHPDFALTKLRERVPGAQVTWNPVTGGAKHVFSLQDRLTVASTDDPEAIVRRFLADNAALFGVTSDAFNRETLRATHRYQTRHSGVTHLFFQEYIGKLPVLGGGMKAHVLADGRVLSVSGDVHSREILALAAQTVASPLDAGLAAALAEIGETSVKNLRAPATVRDAVLPLGRDRARRVRVFTLQPKTNLDAWRVIVDAERNEVLRRYNLAWYAAQPAKRGKVRYEFEPDPPQLPEDPPLPQARVFALTPQPNLPRLGGVPPVVERVTRPLGGDPAASPKGWVDPTRFTTIGNNVRAQEAVVDGNDEGGFKPTAENFFFDFPVVLGDANEPPSRFLAASVTNAFYWTNFAHDYFYTLGFDEAAGNFQLDNFGRGGGEYDPVIATVHDPRLPNNAVFLTSEDGTPGRLVNAFWARATPPLDGGFDAEIILHEYTHGLTTRLVGGPMDVSALSPDMSAGMGEGWSDWFALSILTKADDPSDGAYPFGSYVTQNFERGLRRFPYSTDMTVNPVTFADLDPVQTRYPDNATQIHRVGEIWCLALWETRANFIGAYGFDEGRRKIERLVVDALKLTPAFPTMVEARDALLLADQAANRGDNQGLIWRGFAKRGLGFTATAFGSGIFTVRQAFDLPPYLDDAGRIDTSDALVADGETLGISLGRAGLARTGNVTVTVSAASGDSETVTLTEAAAIPALFSGAVKVAVGGQAAPDDGMLQAALGDDITIRFAAASLQTVVKAGRRVVAFEDTLENGVDRWSPEGTWALTDKFAFSPKNSFTDSPTGNYPARANLILTAPTFDLTDLRGAKLTFRHRYELDREFDFGFVEVQREAGGPWIPLAAFTGTETEFIPAEVDLRGFDGTRRLRVRFRLVSDRFTQLDGWYIDDVRLQGGATK